MKASASPPNPTAPGTASARAASEGVEAEGLAKADPQTRQHEDALWGASCGLFAFYFLFSLLIKMCSVYSVREQTEPWLVFT